jgi:hypothetical protein
MAKKTKQQPRAAETRAPADDAGITKMEAVRRALAKLGRDAKPLQLKAFIESALGVEMNADHISTYKGILLRKAGGKRRPGPEPRRRPRPPPRAGSRSTTSGRSRNSPTGSGRLRSGSWSMSCTTDPGAGRLSCRAAVTAGNSRTP